MRRPKLARLIEETPVVVTGIGAVSAAGESVDALWRAVLAGEVSTVRREFEFGGSKQAFAVCPAPELPLDRPEMRAVRRMDRCAQLGWWAARQAWLSAGLESFPEPRRAGVMLGTSRGALGKLKEGFARLDSPRYPPSLSADGTIASLSGVLAQALKLRGPSATVAATCASGAFAIALAAEQIVLGKTDVMLAGGAEAPLTAVTLAQLLAMGVLGSHDDPGRTCRPFDVTRNGLCLGEGSGFLVLESGESARRRGATVLARLSGWATGIDDSGRAGVDPTGAFLVEIATEALEVAGLEAGRIDAVNAHGTGTLLNDAAEARGLSTLLGGRVPAVPCTSTKPVTGHCLGATGALEAVICVESLRHQLLPPTANCLELDPECRLQVQRSKAKPMPLRHLLSNSLGFWGYHAALIFSEVTAERGH
jgi:3-oxoacyl-[acyl-carrier-protein] synthase II